MGPLFLVSFLWMVFCWGCGGGVGDGPAGCGRVAVLAFLRTGEGGVA